MSDALKILSGDSWGFRYDCLYDLLIVICLYDLSAFVLDSKAKKSAVFGLHCKNERYVRVTRPKGQVFWNYLATKFVYFGSSSDPVSERVADPVGDPVSGGVKIIRLRVSLVYWGPLYKGVPLFITNAPPASCLGEINLESRFRIIVPEVRLAHL